MALIFKIHKAPYGGQYYWRLTEGDETLWRSLKYFALERTARADIAAFKKLGARVKFAKVESE